MLVEYVRRWRDEANDVVPVGCVVALAKDRIGWSLCKAPDKFSKKRAVEIAATRAEILKLEDLAFSLAVASLPTSEMRAKAKKLDEYGKDWFIDNFLLKERNDTLTVRQLFPYLESMIDRAQRYFK